ncbi:MAG: hypothetical protein JKP98_16200 [Rhodobacteraceae bacterium]|jgi:hypothetical protein|nr:hypothetical protein [Paracoccaceae bacterium]
MVDTIRLYPPAAERSDRTLTIKSCFGYVNIDLHFLGREVYRNLEQTGQTRDFIVQMMEHQSDQAASRRQAEQIVANLPASEVSAGFEEWRVRAEYEKLRCSH